jgi:hypothetical protein
MSIELLGQPLTAVYAIPGGQARLFERGLTINGAGGEAIVSFAFPPIGRPAIITGSAAARPLFQADAIQFRLGQWQLDQLAPMIQHALAGRLSLVPTGQPPVPVALNLLPGQLVTPQRHLEVGGVVIPAVYGMPVTAAALPERQLYDVAVLAESGGWRVVAPHAIYRRETLADFGIAHITDIHVARRIDRFRSLLAVAGRHEAAKHMYNWNDRFRGFMKYANYLHRIGVLDLIIATGDLVDYIFEDDDDQASAGNFAFMRQLILGQAPGPDFPTVEELRVPILMVPGNHDYRKHPYKLVFDLHWGKDLSRIRNFGGYNLLQDDALFLTNRLDASSSTGVPDMGLDGATRMVEVDPNISGYETLARRGSYVVRLGAHRIVMLDTGHDVGMVTDISDGLRELLGLLSEDEKTFVGGSPNSEGISDEELALLSDALAQAPDDGLFIVGLHAPLFNMWDSEYPYYLRETQRPAQNGQIHGFLARNERAILSPPPEAQIERNHPSWFPGPHDHRAPRFVKRTDSQDLMDYGVARGRAEEVMRLLAGVGTRRSADVILSGHIHRHSEFSVRNTRAGELEYAMDFYTQNPTLYYPTKFTQDWRTTWYPPPRPEEITAIGETTYVEVAPSAAPDATPWLMPYAAKFKYQVQVPPYPTPLRSAADPQAWWTGRRPLVLQTGALGPTENSQVSFTGFRVLSVKNNVIDKIHFVAMETLEAGQYRTPWEEAIRPLPMRRHLHVERSRPLGAPAAMGAPTGILFPALGVTNVVYRDATGQLHELWQQGSEVGTGNLSAHATGAPRAKGDPSVYIDTTEGLEVALYRGTDDHVHSLYWSTGAVGHDSLSAATGAPKANGNPVGYVGTDGYKHVIYRRDNGHLQELWWTGPHAPGHGDLTAAAQAPIAKGDPAAYVNTRTGENIVVYRGTDSHIYTLYWSDGPIGYSNASAYVGSPLAAGDPFAYYTHHNDAHQITYRSHDGHLHELWWNGNNPASHWDLTAAAGGAPPADSDPAVYYCAGTNTKHVIYRSADGHLNEIWWIPGGGMPAHVDLTVYALAPLAVDRPAAFATGNPNTQHVVYRGVDGHIHEIRWS